MNIDKKKTIAIGDYDNDIPMLRLAGLGIAVSNASENAKKVADLITVSNEEHIMQYENCRFFLSYNYWEWCLYSV